MKTVAQLRNVSKIYGSGDTKVTALQDISLTLKAGELILIEGPSGGGKTTLLQILGLLLRADVGEVEVAGQRWDDATEKELTEARRNHIAFVFQDFNLLNSLSAHDNIDLVADLHGGGEERTNGILSKLGLSVRDTHLPGQLSGGQKQRVSIGRALASDGELVLADEPTANLDWSVGEPVIKLLRRIAHQENRCVVIVSHDARIEPFADRVIELADGRILQDRKQTVKEAAPVTQPTTPQNTTPEPTTPAPLRPADSVDIDVPSLPTSPRRRHNGGGVRAMVMAGALIAMALGGVYLFWTDPATSSATPSAKVILENSDRRIPTNVVAAAPAVVEPPSRIAEIRSDRLGIIKAIKVKPGVEVKPGDVLIELEDNEIKAQVEVRQAELESSKAALADLEAWVRPEEQQEAEALLNAANARLERAKFEWQRMEDLDRRGAAGKKDMQIAKEQLHVAEADVARFTAQLKRAKAGPTKTEIRQAQARVKEAEARLEMAKVALERQKLRAPICANITYIHQEPGEVVGPESPTPIMTLAETGRPRLRAEVDETDIGQIRIGQQVVATTDSFPDRVFRGRVVHMENLMGQRSFRTNRPRERRDVRVREVVIALDEDAGDLPIDLLMTVRFIAMPKAKVQDAETARDNANEEAG